MWVALFITLREGIEAALIVGIVAGFLRQSGYSHLMPKVWLGVILAALYMLMPYQRVFTGPPRAGKDQIADLNGREKTVMTPLVIAMLVLGIWAAPLVSALTPIATQGEQLMTAASAVLSEGSAQ